MTAQAQTTTTEITVVDAVVEPKPAKVRQPKGAKVAKPSTKPVAPVMEEPKSATSVPDAQASEEASAHTQSTDATGAVDAGPASGRVPTGAALFSLGGKAPRNCSTKQLGGVKSGKGAEWAQVAKFGTNTRQLAVDALEALGGTFTMEQALQALAGLGKAVLGSGTPRSYWKAFTANGYIVEAE